MTLRTWLLTITALALAVGAITVPFLASRPVVYDPDPWAHVPKPVPHTDHSPLLTDSLASGPDATRACLKCHRDAGHDVMETSHWTWLGASVRIPGRDEPVRMGKRNLINNYCVGIQSNWERCTACHAGYGWRDDTFDFSNADNIDCLVCHDQTGTYFKSPTDGGHPAEGVDLLAVARSVGRPTRRNCGYCHFQGGGGDAVKHGDMDGTLYFPVERVDVHMGRHHFDCVDCHQSERHDMEGRAISVSADAANRLSCTSCHSAAPHALDRLNAHTSAVACQTCHIPRMAVAAATKMAWDWSTAGKDVDVEDPHVYMKIKGSFIYEQNVVPEYFWYNMRANRYLQGDRIDPGTITHLNAPEGNIADPDAKIWPFKVHRGRQIYDRVHEYFLVPKTVGEGGYWKVFDWDLAARLGSEATGLAYSGEYGFAESDMHWPITHMVAPVSATLQCRDCHSVGGRLDWDRLGYDGDPAFRGSPRAQVSGGAASQGGGGR